MTIQELVVSIFLAIVGSSALWQTVTWFVDRYDKRKTSKEDIFKEVERCPGRLTICRTRLTRIRLSWHALTSFASMMSSRMGLSTAGNTSGNSSMIVILTTNTASFILNLRTAIR